MLWKIVRSMLGGIVMAGCGGTPDAHVTIPSARPAPEPPASLSASAGSATPSIAAPEPAPPGLIGCVSEQARARLEACPPVELRGGAAKASARAGSGRLGGSHRALREAQLAPLDPASRPKVDPSSDDCARRVVASWEVLEQSAGDKDRAKAALDEQLKTYLAFRQGSAPSAQKRACGARTLELVAETALRWHAEAVGGRNASGTKDAKTLVLAQGLYESLLAVSAPEDFAQFQSARLAESDWPTPARVRYALADLLYFQKDWARCGPAFEAAVAAEPAGPVAAEAGFAALLCYQNSLVTNHVVPPPISLRGPPTRPADFAPFDLGEFEVGMLAAFGRYLCSVAPRPGNKEAADQAIEVAFARARTWFEAQHWEEAAIGFRKVALEHPEAEAGIFAAQLYLEATNILANRLAAPQPACTASMRADLPLLIARHCGANRAANAEHCDVLERVRGELSPPAKP